MRRYASGLFLVSILMIAFGFITQKITGESFQYISFPNLFQAILKALVVIVVLALGLTAAIPSLLLDVVLAIFTDYDFPMLGQLLKVVWEGVTMSWFWEASSGSSIFFGALILLLISIAFMRRRGRDA